MSMLGLGHGRGKPRFGNHMQSMNLRRMLGDRRLDPEEVESVEVSMGRAQVTVLVYDRPQTRWEAEFSGQYGIAAAVILGRMGVPELADEVSCVAAYLEQRAARVRLLSCDGTLAWPLPRLPSFEPVG